MILNPTIIISGGGGGGALSIGVTAPTGASVSASKDGATYPGAEDAQNPGRFSIPVPEYGTYTVVGSYRGTTKTRTVTLTEESTEFDFTLPDGYTRLSFLESAGAQHIETGLSMPTGFRLVCDVMVRSGGNADVFGAQGAGDAGRNLFGFANGGFAAGAGGYYTGGSASQNVRYSVAFSNLNDTLSLVVDGSPVSMSAAAGGSGRTAVSAYLFANNRNGSPGNRGSLRIYGPLSVYDTADDTGLRAAFYPARRESDSALGMYDTVRGQFFPNAGSGSFIGGEEV